MRHVSNFPSKSSVCWYERGGLALGIPTGPHGTFRDFQVDAITMEVSPKLSSYKARQNEFLLRGGRLVEGVIRSVNNLLEKFHQSFFLYLLTSPNRFVSVGVYMIAFALLIAPLPLVAASLFINADKSNSNVEEKTRLVSLPAFKSWKWLNAAKTVFVVHLWGAIVTLLPQFFSILLQDSSIPTKLLIWVSLSLVSLLILQVMIGSSGLFTRGSRAQRTEWALLKSVTITAAFIGLSYVGHKLCNCRNWCGDTGPDVFDGQTFKARGPS